MSVSKLLSRIVAPQLNKEELSAAKQHEQLLLHDHTYGITSDPLTQFSVVLSALIHDGKCSGWYSMMAPVVPKAYTQQYLS
jgi:hypothetical protein